MNILLVGLGSIGKRHLNNLVSLGYNKISIVTRSGVLPSDLQNFKAYKTIEEALEAEHFQVGIICTPTAQHTNAIVKLLEANITKLYIEKPISHNWQYVERIIELSQQNKTQISVGYDLHFDLGLQKVKSLLEENTIGKLITANATVGQYLPDWRPHEDYRNGMSANVETGGGVLLDLVHEFDYLYWLVGSASQLAAICKNSGTLEINTEDVAEVLLQFNNGVLGTIHLDYLQQKLVRNCLFTGSNGSIFWNLAENKVSWITSDKQEHSFSYKEFERNDRFLAIMRAFMETPNDARLTNLTDGLQSLKMVLAAKYSSASEKFISLKNFSPS